MMIKKILFLHGFFASGSCIPAQALKQVFTGKAEVLTPDLPLHPNKALAFIEDICKQEKPCVLVGNSNGAFLAQIVASRHELPALLGNPYLEMTCFLIERIGEHEYKSPRADGHQQFVIDQLLIDEFADIQAHQWDDSSQELSDRIWGLFGENDHLWHTLNRCSCNIIRMPIIFPVGIHLQRKKCGSIMRRWRRGLCTIALPSKPEKPFSLA